MSIVGMVQPRIPRRDQFIRRASATHELLFWNMCIDLHGDSNIGETPPDGYTNENVFDIQQGVCITLLVRSSRDNAAALHMRRSGVVQGRSMTTETEIPVQPASGLWSHPTKTASSYPLTIAIKTSIGSWSQSGSFRSWFLWEGQDTS